ncbi:MAG: class I SAM-dependent methyltransferase [Acidobacteriia bacterium]|nr:class I SAM-dependent methyltransferase [Terriglobia bacterium]
MLNARLHSLAERWLPGALLRALDPFEALISDRLAAFVATLPDRSHVLDAGAGQCRYASAFLRHRYVALDISVGDSSWDYSQLDILGDLEKLPIANSAFDAAISIVVLEHVREPQEVMRETARVLRPGGRFFIVVPNQWEVHQAPYDYFRFTRYGLEHLLVKSGFRIQRVEAIGGFFWLMSRRSINLLTFFQGGLKWVIFLLLAPFLGFLIPILFYFADRLDRRKDFTLGYICEASREG